MDDIRYLAHHSKEESYLFMCDSKSRDVDVFPTPSEYQIAFATPFRNVFSVDLIDATVPRTEYTVEVGRNTLTYAVQGQPTRRVALSPGDYALPQLVEALNAVLVDGLRVETLTVPSELSNKVKFVCPLPFVLHMDGRSGLRDCLGFANPVNQADVSYFTAAGAGQDQYAAPPGWTQVSPASREFRSVEAQDAFGTSVTVLEGPVPIDAYEPVYPGRALRQYFTPAAGGNPAAALVRGVVVGQQAWGLTISVHVASAPATALASVAAAYSAEQEAWVATFPASQAQIPAGARCFVQITAAQGDAQSHVGVYRAQSNAPLAGNRGDGEVVVVLAGGAEAAIAEAQQDLSVDLVVAAKRHQIVSPGLVDLTGERYIMVRCPEVEQLMYRERANERHHAGLGMVKLSGYGYRDQRYDFVSFPPRRFHAKSVLTKLTIRMEKADGTLYNAHGVDHTLLLVVRYYSQPNHDMSASASTLSPGYTPDLHAHLGTRKLAEEERRRFHAKYDRH